jgi:hypothetical protein
MSWINIVNMKENLWHIYMCDEKATTLRFAPIFDKRQLQRFLLYTDSKSKDQILHKINKFFKKTPLLVVTSFPVEP